MEKISLDKIIQPGSLIKIKTKNTEWLSNVAQKIYDNYFEAEYSKDFIENNFAVGDSIKCKYSSEGCEYVLDGKIENIENDSAKAMKIYIEKTNKFDNTRQFTRYDAYIISKISVNREEPAFSVVTSLSSSGMSVVSKTNLPTDIEAFIEVFVDTGNTIRFYGDIVRKTHSESGYEYGIKLKQIDKNNEEILGSLLQRAKEKDETVLSRFNNLKK